MSARTILAGCRSRLAGQLLRANTEDCHAHQPASRLRWRVPFGIHSLQSDPRRNHHYSSHVRAIADGVDGEIRLPFQPTFWSAGFGVLIDRYAIPWEINSTNPAAS
jgi:uncharacterized glyoxalase superfamily protein PhnB